MSAIFAKIKIRLRVLRVARRRQRLSGQELIDWAEGLRK